MREQHSQFELLGQRRFAPFFWTQFFGAGNDNVFKFAFTILVTYHAAEFGGINSSTAAFLIGAVFIAPFVLFSATSGQLADKFEKSMLIRWVKNLEIGIMLLGATGFLMHSAPVLFTVTFLMGVHSTLFGPVKYAYLPQHLGDEELIGGNGMVEMGTFVAILLGTMLGGELADRAAGPQYVAIACIAIAILGRTAAGFVPHSPSSAPDLSINWNPFTETWRNLKLARSNRTVFLIDAGHLLALVLRGDVSHVVRKLLEGNSAAAMRRSSRCCWRFSRSASAWVRLPANGFRGTRSRSDWSRSVRSG